MIVRHEVLKGKLKRYLTGLKIERTFKEFQNEFKSIHKIRIRHDYAKKLLKEIEIEDKESNTRLILLNKNNYKIREGVKLGSRI